MELNELTEMAKQNKIKLLNCKMRKTKARIINTDNAYIFFDYNKINSLAEEKCLLAEELGHFYCGAYYNLNSSQEDIDKAEFRATRFEALVCVPPKSILSCFEKRNI